MRIEEYELRTESRHQRIPVWTSWLVATVLLFGLPSCIEPFNPDRTIPFPCESSADCLAAFTCVEESDEETSSNQQTNFCRRRCETEGDRCSKDRQCVRRPAVEGDNASEPNTMLVCIPNDEADNPIPTGGENGDESDTSMSTPIGEDFGAADAGMVVDMCLNPPCSSPGGPLVPPGSGGQTPSCEEVCSDYCEAIETTCPSVICRIDHCLNVCDNLVTTSEIVEARTRITSADCAQLSDVLPESMVRTSEVRDDHLRIGLVCESLCEDLTTLLTDNTNFACDAYLRCGDRCSTVCEAQPFTMAERITLIQPQTDSPNCPFNAVIGGGTDSAKTVADVCLDCESTCDQLFGASRACLEARSSCPALSDARTCESVCELAPSQFYTPTPAEICGSDTQPSTLASNPLICGEQCNSTNNAWGARQAQTEDSTLTAFEFRSTETEQGFYPIDGILSQSLDELVVPYRICLGTNNTTDCDAEISVPENATNFGPVRIQFSPNVAFSEYEMALQFSVLSIMQPNAAERISSLGLQVIDQGAADGYGFEATDTPVFVDGSRQDFLLARRFYGGTENHITLELTAIQPSVLVVQFVSIRDVGFESLSRDNQCQNQCYHGSRDQFCESMCNPNTGLIPICAASDKITGDHPLADANSNTCGAFQFDETSCRRECRRNACDLQYMTIARWRTPTNGEVSCEYLNFRDEYQESSNHLCCGCGQGYCDETFGGSVVGTNVDCLRLSQP